MKYIVLLLSTAAAECAKKTVYPGFDSGSTNTITKAWQSSSSITIYGAACDDLLTDDCGSGSHSLKHYETTGSGFDSLITKDPEGRFTVGNGLKMKSKNYPDGWKKTVNWRCLNNLDSSQYFDFLDVTMRLYSQQCDPGYEVTTNFINNGKTLTLTPDTVGGPVTIDVVPDVMSNAVSGDSSCVG